MKYSLPMQEIRDRIHGPGVYHTATRMDVDSLASQLSALEKMAVSRHPKDTEEAHLLKLEAAGKQLMKRREMIQERIENRTRETLRDIDQQVRNQLGMQSTPYGQEVRTALRQMSVQDRESAIQKAIDRKDGAFFKALEEAPAMLSGMDEKAQSDAVYRFMETNAPALMSQQNQVMDSYMTSMSALKVPKRAVQEGINPDKLREIREAEERAVEAQRSFETPVEG